MTARDILYRAIVGDGETRIDGRDAADRVLAVLPELVDDAMVERAADAYSDCPGAEYEPAIRAALIAALTETPDDPRL